MQEFLKPIQRSEGRVRIRIRWRRKYTFFKQNPEEYPIKNPYPICPGTQ